MPASRPRTMLRQQVEEDDLHTLLPRQLQRRRGQPPEMVQNISRLFIIPPPQRFNFNAGSLQRPPRLLDLNLSSAVRERKWHVAVKENPHLNRERTRCEFPGSDCRPPPFSLP